MGKHVSWKMEGRYRAKDETKKIEVFDSVNGEIVELEAKAQPIRPQQCDPECAVWDIDHNMKALSKTDRVRLKYHIKQIHKSPLCQMLKCQNYHPYVDNEGVCRRAGGKSYRVKTED